MTMAQVALSLHGIGEPHAGVPSDERPYWISEEAFEDLVEKAQQHRSPRPPIFTFDDGNLSDLKAAEALARRGQTGHFFLLTGRFGQPHYCSAQDARELLAMGMVVGLHGRDHVDWRGLDAAGLEQEIVAGRAELADTLGAPVNEVAIPFGAYNRRVMAALKRADFAHILTSDPGVMRAEDRVWNRFTIRADLSQLAISHMLAGRVSAPMRLARALRRTIKRQWR